MGVERLTWRDVIPEATGALLGLVAMAVMNAYFNGHWDGPPIRDAPPRSGDPR
jgi:hypothetical protein